jgi:hypothetical protein
MRDLFQFLLNRLLLLRKVVTHLTAQLLDRSYLIDVCLDLQDQLKPPHSLLTINRGSLITLL